MVHTLISLPIAFIMNVVLARVLGVVDYGRLAFLSSVMDIAGVIVSLGVGAAVVQFGAKAHAAGRADEVRALLSRSTGFRLLVVAPVITVIVAFLADVPAALLVCAIVFGVWLPAAGESASAALTVENRTATDAKLEMVVNLIGQGAVLVALFTLASADSVWNARLIVAGIAAFAAVPLIDRRYRTATIRPRLPRGFPPGFWRFAIPTGLSGIVSTLALSRSEVVLLQWLSDPAEVGLYAMAFGLATHLFAPAQALVNPLLPAISSLWEVDKDAVGRAFTRTLRTLATIIALLMAAAGPMLALLVPLLYGAAFADAQSIVLVLMMTAGITLLATPMTAFVSARLRGFSLLRANVVALVVDLAVALSLIPVLGAWGAVAAKGGVGLVRLLWYLLTEQASFRTSVRDTLVATTPAWSGILAGVAGYGVGAAINAPVLVGAAVGTLVGASLLVALLALTRTGLTARDAAVVVDVLPARARRVATLLARPLTFARDSVA